MLFDCISINKNVMFGKPCIRGTRLTVEFIERKINEGATFAQLIEDYPGILIEDLQQALKYTSYVFF